MLAHETVLRSTAQSRFLHVAYYAVPDDLHYHLHCHQFMVNCRMVFPLSRFSPVHAAPYFGQGAKFKLIVEEFDQQLSDLQLQRPPHSQIKSGPSSLVSVYLEILLVTLSTLIGLSAMAAQIGCKSVTLAYDISCRCSGCFLLPWMLFAGPQLWLCAFNQTRRIAPPRMTLDKTRTMHLEGFHLLFWAMLPPRENRFPWVYGGAQRGPSWLAVRRFSTATLW